MHQTLLMQECQKEKRRFFFYLKDALELTQPAVYESAVQILAEFIDKKIVAFLFLWRKPNE